MKKTEENRYPHSATLFRFCKEALSLRYEGNVKVIDQDVGAILGYDPADCSHWKKGKKNIRALGTLRSIADHLSIDERLLIDITSGRIDLDEAVFEFKGYGTFNLKGRSLEGLKKEFFKNPSRWGGDSAGRSFEEVFDLDRSSILKAVDGILVEGNFTEAPLHIPELFNVFPGITLIIQPDAELPYAVEYQENGPGGKVTAKVTCRGPDVRPYLRFLAVKELFRFLCKTGHKDFLAFSRNPEELLDIQGNVFAGLLLVPDPLLHKEVIRVDCAKDIVNQLSDVFWVSKSLMNQRLRDFLEHLG